MFNRLLFPFNRLHTKHLLYEYLVVPVLLILVAYLMGHGMLFGQFDARKVARIQTTLTEKQVRMDAILDEVDACFDSIYITRDPFMLLDTWQTTLQKDEMSLFLFHEGRPVFWSDNEVTYNDADFPLDSMAVSGGAAFLGSHRHTAFMWLADGGYVVHRRERAGFVLVGCLRIRHVYALQNKFLSNQFRSDFNLPAEVKISTASQENGASFYDLQGQFLFSLIFSGIYPFQIHVPALLYLLSLLILMNMCCYRIPLLIKGRWNTWYLVAVSVGTCVALYVVQSLHLPHVFYNLRLFSPEVFASSQLFPSLGNLAVWCALLLALTYMFNLHFQPDLTGGGKWRGRLLFLSGLTLTVVSFHGIRALVRTIVVNSGLFALNMSPLKIDPAHILVYAILLMQSFTFIFLLTKTLTICLETPDYRTYLQRMAGVLCVVEVVKLGFFEHPSPMEVLLLVVVLSYAGYRKLVRHQVFRMHDFVALTMVLAFFITGSIVHDANHKHAVEMEQRAVMLSLRQDPVAESLMATMYGKLLADEELEQAVSRAVHGDLNEAQLGGFLKDRYGAGYLQRYEMETALCIQQPDPGTGAPFWQDGRLDFFDELVSRQGVRVRPDIWFIEEPTSASAAYLLKLAMPVDSLTAHLFLILTSKPYYTQAGYPQLLLDDRVYVQPTPTGYSYAIYYRQNLMQSQGLYDYNLTSRVFDRAMPESGMWREKRYRHYVYHTGQSQTIVVTRHIFSLIPCIVLFSCIELTFLLLWVLGMLLMRLTGRRLYHIVWNFRRQFQISIIGMLFLFSVTMCVCVVIFFVNQVRVKDMERIRVRLQAVSRELEDVTRDRQSLWLVRGENGTSRQLNEDLMTFSDIFDTDIHVYDTDGMLLGTSREELFSSGLCSRRINPRVYRDLISDDQRLVILKERIGGLRYSSGYLIWQDASGRPMAIIALPYFEERERLVTTITEVMAAAINITVLVFIIAVLLAMIISRTITQPLHMIQEKISQISLDNVNNKIVYRHDDEIGGLVKAYNEVVDELAVNIQKLARSEREAVWRDMAKQVSHEINNPLTPMKLSVQHLQRAWASRSEKFDGYMETIPKMLIEQIDLLSSISQEFSNFAKMPSAFNQPMNIVDTVSNAIVLYGSEQVNIQFDYPDCEQILIFADKEQMLRVFSNLFKNAEQAVPAGREPVIRVTLLCRDSWVYIRVRDNGTGIPPEMQARIFKPEFTTKSKGMGLGLAIVKNTIEAAGGTIDFQTWPQRGTSFIMRLPVWTGGTADVSS